MKTLDKIGQDLQRGVDSLTKDGSEEVKSRNSFTCGFLFLTLLLLIPAACIPLLPRLSDLAVQTAAQAETGQLMFGLAYSAMLVGFPVRALDLAIGLLYPLERALTIVAAGRLLGLSLCYAFGQLCLQSSLNNYTSVRSSEKYYLAIYRRPWSFMSFLRLIYLPAGFQSYLCAACRVSYFSYLLPAFFFSMLTSAAQIYFTRGVTTFPEVLNFRIVTDFDKIFYSSLTAISLISMVLMLIAWKRTAANGEELRDIAK